MVLRASRLAKEDLVEQMHRGGRKKSLAWAYATPFSVVHQTTGEEAPEKYLQAVLLCYALQEKGGVSKNAAHLTEVLDKAEFARYVNELLARKGCEFYIRKKLAKDHTASVTLRIGGWGAGRKTAL